MNDKKRIILTVIGIVFILILIFGATYAYFSVEVTNDNGVTNVDVDADEIGSVALTNPTPNLHLSLSSKDMSLDNVGEYYATNDSNKYFDEEKIQREILGINLIGGNSSDVYECNATLNINLEGTAVNAFQKGDAYIQFGGLLSDKVDLTEIPSDGYDISAYLVPEQSATRKITASIALVNKVGDQSYLAGKSLSVNITNSDFNCTLTEMGNNTITSSNSGTLAISGAVGTELNNYKIYGNSIQNGTPSPTNPVEIESVGDYDKATGKYIIPITVKGNNLFDKNNIDNKNWYLNNGVIAVHPSIWEAFILPCEPSTTYTYQIFDGAISIASIGFFDEYPKVGDTATNYIRQGQINLQTLTSTENSKYMVLEYYNNYTSLTKEQVINSISVSKGNGLSQYESFVEPFETNIYLDDPLRKIGDAEDYIDFANQNIIRNVAIRELNGSESWVDSLESRWTYTHFKGKKWGNNLISNYFANRNDSSVSINYIEGKSNNTAVSFKLDSSVAITVDEWKLWLETKNDLGTPLMVQYELEEPVKKVLDLPNISITENSNVTIEIGTSVTPSGIEANYLTEN